MAETTKERKLEILQYRINMITEKVNAWMTYGISVKKINKLNMMKDQFEASKAVIEAS